MYDLWARPDALWAVRTLNRLGCTAAVYTAAAPDYADAAIRSLDMGAFFNVRLYRSDCVDPRGSGKDLARVAARIAPDQPFGPNRNVLIDDCISNRVEGQPFYHVAPYEAPFPATDHAMTRLVVWAIARRVFGPTLSHLLLP